LITDRAINNETKPQLDDGNAVSDMAIALMMEAVRTSETSFNFNVTTRRYLP
jgi:hypothetical protein